MSRSVCSIDTRALRLRLGAPDRLRRLARRALGGVAVAALALVGASATAQGRTEIHFWHAMQGARGEAVEALVGEFNQSQPRFEVKAAFKGEYPELLAAAAAAYRQKTSPHIIQVFDIGTQSMLLHEATVPIQRLMRQQQTEVDWGDFLPTISAYYAKDDRLYSMPFNVSAPILYYNKDIFAKAGLGDAPPATWPEVEAASRKILAAGAARCGFTTGGSPSWSLLENSFAWHGQPFATNQNGYAGLDTKLLINSSFGRMHVGALAKWHQEGIFVYGGREGSGERFITGDCAMIVAESGLIGNFEKTLGFNWGTGQLPHWGAPYPKGNTLLGGATLWVLRGREPDDYQGVAQFLKFLATPRQQIGWATATGFVPVTRTALDHLKASSFYKDHPEQWTAMSQLLNASPGPHSRGIRLGYFSRVRDAIESELVLVFEGRKTADEGLDAAVVRGNAILRAFRVINGAAGQGEI
jgi:sn-glycerol 3-phosphate transport system substrate-binding protein